MVSTPITMPSAHKHASVASWGMPYDWQTKKQEPTACFDGSAYFAGTTQQLTAVALQPLSATTLKETEGKYSHGQNLRQYIQF